jgi:hypothetical protein
MLGLLLVLIGAVFAWTLLVADLRGRLHQQGNSTHCNIINCITDIKNRKKQNTVATFTYTRRGKIELYNATIMTYGELHDEAIV